MVAGTILAAPWSYFCRSLARPTDRTDRRQHAGRISVLGPSCPTVQGNQVSLGDWTSALGCSQHLDGHPQEAANTFRPSYGSRGETGQAEELRKTIIEHDYKSAGTRGQVSGASRTSPYVAQNRARRGVSAPVPSLAPPIDVANDAFAMNMQWKRGARRESVPLR